MPDEVDKHVLKKYDVGRVLGKGAYGIVWLSTKRSTGEKVALKKIFDAFQNATDAQRTYREVVFLKQLAVHENIVKMHSVFKADNDRDLYLVFELVETDLHACIRANILTELQRKYIMYQCFKAMAYVHAAFLIHRDLKPANILLTPECLVKVADFGLARTLHLENTANVLTDYIATRWYRAPEILLGSAKYSSALDMWSMGIILGEMIGAPKPVFPGTSTLNQLERICQVVGFPTKEDIESFQSPFAATMLDSLKLDEKTKQHPDGWQKKYPKATKEEVALLGALMCHNPNNRMTAAQGQTDPYCKHFHDHMDPGEEDPPKESAWINIDDNKKLKTGEYRQKLYEDCVDGYKKPE